jgi:hypothetical protein
MSNTNPKVEIAGVNHLAAMCRDSKETVALHHGIRACP